MGCVSKVLDYLGRYTHRVAISNHRLVRLQDGKVTFRWKDYSHGNRIRLTTIDVNEFIRRFLLHVLPAGFVRLRHYGLLSNRDRAQRLARCRKLITQTDCVALQLQHPMDWKSRYEALTGVALETCPLCHIGRMVCVELIASSVRGFSRRRSNPCIDSS